MFSSDLKMVENNETPRQDWTIIAGYHESQTPLRTYNYHVVLRKPLFGGVCVC